MNLHRDCLVFLIAGAAAFPAFARGAITDLPLPDPSLHAKLDLNNDPVAAEAEPQIQYAEAETVKSVIDLVQSDPHAALKKLTDAVTPQSSAMFDFIIGNLNFQLNDRENALRYYEEAVKKAPGFAKAYKNLGYLALQSEKFDEALKSFLKTVELGSSEGAVYGLIGYIYLARESFTPAESAYRTAMLKMPDNMDWKMGLGRADMGNQKHADVMNIMTELIEHDPTKRDYWLVHANSFLSMDRVMDAAYDYEIMARMGLGDKETFQALGNIYVSQNMPPLALIAFETALKLPEPPPMERMLGAAEVMGARGAIEETTELAKRMEAVYGKDAPAKDTIRLLKLQSQLAIARDDQAAAQDYLEKLVKLDDSDGQTILLLADFYARAGQFEKAAPLYERAEKLEGFETDALIKHGQMLVNKGDYGAAIPILERAVERLGKTDDTTRRDNVGRYLEAVRRMNRNTQF